jgi:hypothetical protein
MLLRKGRNDSSVVTKRSFVARIKVTRDVMQMDMMRLAVSAELKNVWKMRREQSEVMTAPENRMLNNHLPLFPQSPPHSIL